MSKRNLKWALVGLLINLSLVNFVCAVSKKNNGSVGKAKIAISTGQLQSVATEQEAREVDRVVTTFMKRVRETRDFASARELYLNDFLQRQIDAERDYIFPERMISSLPFGPSNTLYMPIWSQISYQDWERLYFAYENLIYMRVLYIVTHNSPSDAVRYRNEYPAEVDALLKGNKILKEYKMISSVEELRNIISTLEQAAEILRKLFKKQPPEETQIYKEAVRSYPVSEPQYSAGASVYVHPEGRYGFPRRTRFFFLRTKPQLFEMTLVRVDEGMKIVWARVYPFN